MANWWHRLMNPHCPECIADRECKSCDELRSLLNNEKREKDRLLQAILDREKPKPIEEPAKLEPIELAAPVPWRVRQQLLENEDRAKAAALKHAREQEQIGSLEKEVGIGSAS